MNEIEIEVDPADFGCQTARVVSICVAEGQQVARGETLIEFECDKASFEVSMPEDGTVRHFLLQEGNKVTKTMTVASILTEQTEARIDDSEVVDQKLNLIKERYHSCDAATTFRSAVETLEAGLQIRKASVEDAVEIRRLWRESYAKAISDDTFLKPKLSEDLAWFQRQIAQGEEIYVVAELPMVGIIGCAKVFPVRRNPTSTFYILGLFVDHPDLPWSPGRQLIKSALDRCNSKDSPIVAYTHPRNEPAIRLLKHSGFVRVGEMGIHGDKEARLVFELEGER